MGNSSAVEACDTAVLFLVFNRPDTTAQVFDAIRKAKPPRLYVAADGPRPNKHGEDLKVAEVKEIVSRVDWPCEVKTLYREGNLGCKVAVSEAITWFFEQEEEGIVLEDDCLPHPTFFRFCGELLARYRDDERIAMISGDNFQFGRRRGEASYYYSRYNHIWGWASWRRAWKHYDREASSWPALRDGEWLNVLVGRAAERKYWAKVFEAVYQGRIDTWDYQWALASWVQGMVSILPNVNLISNIGFGGDATHTHGKSVYADMQVEPMEFPLCHPAIVLPHGEADAFTSKGMFTTSLLRRILQKMRAIIG